MLNNFGLGILITAKDRASMVFDKVHQKLGSLAKESERTQKKLQAATMAFGLGMTSLGTGLATLGGLGVSTKMAADFQTGMVGVQKTTGMAGSEIKALRGGLLKLSTQMPQSAKELAAIGEVGGQLGIQGEKNLMAFTEATAKLTQVSEFSAETGGEAMAKLANQFKLPIAQASNIGSVLNELSNVSTATAVDVADLSNRMAGAGHTAGLTFPQIAGIGAALKDLGVSNEVGGTAMSDMFLEMLKQTKDWAEVMGISEEKFKGMVKQDAAGALIAFINAMRKFDKFQVASKLGDLGIGGTRAADVFLKLMEATKGQNGQMSMLERRMQTATSAFSQNTSLNTEYNTGLQALNAQLDILKNNFSAVAISVGDVLIPPLTKAAEAVSGFVRNLVDWTQKNPELTEGIVKMVAAFGGLAAVGGTISTVVGALGMMGTALGGLPAATAALGAIAPALTPIVAGLAAAAAAGAALVVAWKNDFGGLKTTVLPFIREIKVNIGKVVDVVRAAITLFQGGALGKELEASLNANGLLQTAKGVANVMKGIVSGVKGFIKGFAEALGPNLRALIEALREAFSSVAPVIKNLFDAFGSGGGQVSSVSGAIGEFMGKIAGVATLPIKAAAFAIKLLVTAFKVLVGIGEGIGAAAFHIVGFFEKVGGAIGSLPQKLRSLGAFFGKGVSAIQTFAATVQAISLEGFLKFSGALKGMAGSAVKLASSLGGKVLGGLSSFVKQLSNFGSDKIEALKNNLAGVKDVAVNLADSLSSSSAGQAVMNMSGAMKGKLLDAKTLAVNFANDMGTALQGKLGQLKQKFAFIGQGLAVGFTGMKDAIVHVFASVLELAKRKIDALFGTMKGAVNSLTQIWGLFKTAVYGIWDQILEKVNLIVDKVKKAVSGLIPEPVRNLLSAIGDKLSEIFATGKSSGAPGFGQSAIGVARQRALAARSAAPVKKPLQYPTRQAAAPVVRKPAPPPVKKLPAPVVKKPMAAPVKKPVVAAVKKPAPAMVKKAPAPPAKKPVAPPVKKHASGGFVSRTGFVQAILHRGEVITPEPTVGKLVALAERLDRQSGGAAQKTHNAPVTNNIHISLPGVRDLRRENLDELAAVIVQKLKRLQERQREAAFGNDFGPSFVGVNT